MTGTGTQTDPYIITSWAEFTSAASESGAYLAFPEGGGEIDLNDGFEDGIERLDLACAQIDGNGWTVRNLASPASPTGSPRRVFDASSGTIVNDLNFTDMYLSDQFFLYGQSYGSKWNKCRFSGKIFSTTTNPSTGGGFLYGSASFYRCSFNIDGAGTVYLTNVAGSFEACHIHYTGELMKAAPALMTSCLVSGGFAFSQYGNSRYGDWTDSNSNSKANVVSAEILGDGGSIQIGRSTSAANIICTDNVSESVTVSSYLIGVTAEQMRSADYLASIGFPIGVD